MYYRNSTEPMNMELLEAVLSGKAIIFEGEEDAPDTEENEELTEETPTDENQENTETSEETPSEQPTETPTEEQLAEQGDADSVNSEDPVKPEGKEVNAEQLVALFKKSGNLKTTVEIAMQKTGKGKKLTKGDLLPYLKKAIVEFCKSAGDKGAFHTNAAQMGLAVKQIEQECGVNDVQKQKEIEAKQQKAAEQKAPPAEEPKQEEAPQEETELEEIPEE